jgi:hypothetical protein
MGFKDLIEQEKKALKESQGGDLNVKFPETKHDRIFMGKDVERVIVQVLPSADLYSRFAEPVREIFLSATKKDGSLWKTNFKLPMQPEEGHILETKIQEWAAKNMIPSGFGGQQKPSVIYMVNVVKVVKNASGELVQETDENGQLKVRVMPMKGSAYAKIMDLLGDEMSNPSGHELSFMNPDAPCPVAIEKPEKNAKDKSYKVTVYPHKQLPALPAGWENQLEDLKAQATPTDELEGGEDLLNIFIAMKEGKPIPRKGENSGAANQETQQSNQRSEDNPFGKEKGAPPKQEAADDFPNFDEEDKAAESTGADSSGGDNWEDDLDKMMEDDLKDL